VRMVVTGSFYVLTNLDLTSMVSGGAIMGACVGGLPYVSN
jgi:hypothetical protein